MIGGWNRPGSRKRLCATARTCLRAMSGSGISTDPGPERDAADPQSAADDAVYVAYLRTRTPEQLRDLAVSTIAAERETGTLAPAWLAEAEQSSSAEAELEAGS